MERSARSFARSMKTRQRLPYMIAARVDGTGAASILAGDKELTLTDNGTGDYTLTFAQSFGQIPVVVATSVTGAHICQVFAVSKTACTIKVYDDAGVAVDSDFHVVIVGSDAEDAV